MAVQGETRLRCAKMTVLYASGPQSPGETPLAEPSQAKGRPGAIAAAPAQGATTLREIDCEGDVSIVSGTQSANANALRYDAARETVTLTGNVVIADCENVQRGERAIYDVKTGRATIDAGPKGRVQGIFAGNPSGSAGAAPKACPPLNAPSAGRP